MDIRSHFFTCIGGVSCSVLAVVGSRRHARRAVGPVDIRGHYRAPARLGMGRANRYLSLLFLPVHNRGAFWIYCAILRKPIFFRPQPARKNLGILTECGSGLKEEKSIAKSIRTKFL